MTTATLTNAAAAIPADQEETAKARSSILSSLRVQVGVLYVVLTLANLIFFAAIIIENQMDVLNDNVVLQADRAASQIMKRISDNKRAGQSETQLIEDVVRYFTLSAYSVRNRAGAELAAGKAPIPFEIGAFKHDLAELDARSLATDTPYHVRVDPAGFQVRYMFLLPEDRVLVAAADLESIKSRLRGIYWQLGLAMAWGVVFHILFGIYLVRRIFMRLNDLRSATSILASGDLSRRTTWKRRAGDELDTLGDSFDSMAHTIQHTVGQLRTVNQRLNIELQIGRQVQKFFLRGQEIFQDYKPALVYRPLSEVSGDIYNFFKINDRFRGVFLADATGHGVSAALVTSVLFFHLNKLLAQEKSPLKIIRALSAQLKTDLNELFFATALFMLFDSRGDLFFVNAGHNAPMIYRRKTGRLIELETTGMMLGLDLGDLHPYEMKRVPVRPGDRVLLFTDGLVESSNGKGDMFGAERVQQILRDTADRPGAEVVALLEKEVLAFCPAMTDDLTILILDIPEP